MRFPMLLACAALSSCFAQFFPATTPSKATEPPVAATGSANGKQLTVPGNQPWTDSGIDVQPGDLLRFQATGTLKFVNAKQENGPDGLARAWTDMIRALPVVDGGRGALIGRIGDRATTRPFMIGTQREQRVGVGGRLFVGINTVGSEGASGSFNLTIERVPGAASGANGGAVPATAKAPVAIATKLTQAQLDSIPRRVVGDDGTPGDRTNFVLVGSEAEVRDALQKAGWVTVDRTKKDAVLRSLMTIMSKQAYTTLPMSELMMFGRAQDFGYAQGDPLRVVAARHHFRIWKAPFKVGKETVWVGAGTHDVGFDKDQRNGKITHKIDPETDKERDYIGESLKDTGEVIGTEYMTAADPITKAKTAHGQEFFSDGRTLVIYLRPDGGDATDAFADTFCSVLKNSNPDGGDWGDCARWIEHPGKTSAPVGAIPGGANYRVVVVPGFFSSCFPEAPAYQEAWEPMKKLGWQIDVFGVPNDSSEDNAAKIAAYLKAEIAKDKRKFILFGYSKGTPDIQVMLAKNPELRASVAAFVAVAGASGGSFLADASPAVAEKYMNQFQISKACQGDVAKGFRSLQKRDRQAFLAANPDPYVPTYSLPAIADDSIMSKAVASTAKVIAAYDRAQDGQLTRPDAIVPGSKVLGAAKSDHFALALPFEKAKGSTFGSMMDKNHYPRGALMEAMVRFVVADLGLK